MEAIARGECLSRANEVADAITEVGGEVCGGRFPRYRIAGKQRAAGKLRVGRDAASRCEIPTPHNRREPDAVGVVRGVLSVDWHNLERPLKAAAQCAWPFRCRENASPRR